MDAFFITARRSSESYPSIRNSVSRSNSESSSPGDSQKPSHWWNFGKSQSQQQLHPEEGSRFQGLADKKENENKWDNDYWANAWMG